MAWRNSIRKLKIKEINSVHTNLDNFLTLKTFDHNITSLKKAHTRNVGPFFSRAHKNAAICLLLKGITEI